MIHVQQTRCGQACVCPEFHSKICEAQTGSAIVIKPSRMKKTLICCVALALSKVEMRFGVNSLHLIISLL